MDRTIENLLGRRHSSLPQLAARIINERQSVMSTGRQRDLASAAVQCPALRDVLLIIEHRLILRFAGAVADRALEFNRAPRSIRDRTILVRNGVARNAGLYGYSEIPARSGLPRGQGRLPQALAAGPVYG